MKKALKTAVAIMLAVMVASSVFPAVSLGVTDRELTVTILDAGGNEESNKTLDSSGLEMDVSKYPDIHYNLNYSAENGNIYHDIITAKGPSVEEIIKKITKEVGLDYDDISMIKFIYGDSSVSPEYSKEYFTKERYFFKNDGTNAKEEVPGILSIADNYHKADVEENDKFTLLFGMKEDEYSSNMINDSFITGITGLELRKRGTAPSSMKITGEGINENRELKLTAEDKNGKQLGLEFGSPEDDKRVIWSSSDPSKVKVDIFGKITYVSDGEVVITAQSALNDKLKDSIVVNKTEVQPDVIPSSDIVFNEGEGEHNSGTLGEGEAGSGSKGPGEGGGEPGAVLTEDDLKNISGEAIPVQINPGDGGSSSNSSGTNGAGSSNGTNSSSGTGGTSSGGTSSGSRSSSGTTIRRNSSPSNSSRRSSGSSSSSSYRRPTSRSSSSSSSRSSSRSSRPGSSSSSSSSRSGTSSIRRSRTATDTNKDDEEENKSQGGDVQRGVLKDIGEGEGDFDEFYDGDGTRWRVFEVEESQKEMPQLNLTGKLDPIAIIVMTVILAIGGIQRYIRYLDSI